MAQMTEIPAGAAPAESTPFTAAGAWRGFVVTQAFALGGLVYGMTFGILALGNGLSLVEAMFMSLTVFSGSGQIAAVGAMNAGAGLYATVATVVLLNARYVLYGAALRPWLGGIAPLKAYSLLYLVGDANWVANMRAREEGERDAGFVLGSGLALFFPWMAGTLIGALTGGWIPQPKALALDFFLIGFCAAMVVGIFRGKPNYLSAAVALAAALLADRFLSGGWPIVAAGVAGILVAYGQAPPKDAP